MTFLITLLVALSLSGWHAPGLPEQEQSGITADDTFYYLQLDEKNGVPVEEFVDLCKEITGQPLKYNSLEMNGHVIRIHGIQKVRRDKSSFFEYFEAVMASHGFFCKACGPEEKPYFITVNGIETTDREGDATRKVGRVIPRELIDHFKGKPGQLITTTFPLNARDVLLPLKDVIFQEGVMLEIIEADEKSDSFVVITSLAIKVWGITRLIELVDVIDPDAVCDK
jgi:hypothetical protein